MPKEKKEIGYRPMYGFPDPAKIAAEERAKDELIKQLKASIDVLEARDAKRLQAAREGMRKFRARPKP